MKVGPRSSVQFVESQLERSRSLRHSDKRRWPMALGLLLVVAFIAGIFSSSSAAIAGAWCIALMLLLLFLSVPVAISLAIPSLIGTYAVSGIPASVGMLSTAPFDAASSWTMSVLPMFIFLGMLLSESGIAVKIYDAAGKWFNWLPGGVGISTTVAGAGLASVSGSTIGMTYTLGRAGIPEMLRAGFDKRLAFGTVIMAGLPGGLIPPSVLLVVYAGLASVPVGPQLIAGVVPGILIAALFSVVIFGISVIAPQLAGRDHPKTVENSSVTWGSRFKSLASIWSLLLIIATLFGGMFSGVFTPTEAGAASAFIAVLLTLYYARNDGPFARVQAAAAATVSATASVYFLIIGAEMLMRMLALTGVARKLTEFVSDLGLGRVAFLLVLVVFYLVLGMFFDTLSMLLLTVPILLPTLGFMDINLLWFGIFVVLLGELAMVTPPLGILPYIVLNIAKDPAVNLGQDVKLTDVLISVAWFLPFAVLFLVFLIFVPEVAEWLPAFVQ